MLALTLLALAFAGCRQCSGSPGASWTEARQVQGSRTCSAKAEGEEVMSDQDRAALGTSRISVQPHVPVRFTSDSNWNPLSRSFALKFGTENKLLFTVSP